MSDREGRPGPLGHAEFLGLRRFTALDGLRAVAVLLVISEHIPQAAPLLAAVDGAQGVTLFFILSGFLITTLALREEDARGRLDLKAFYIRRTMRIFPAYYGTLALYCAIVFGLDADFAVQERGKLLDALPWYLTYLNEYHLQATLAARELLPVFGQSWSLAVEEKFYLVWPFLGFALLRAKPWPRFAAAGGLCVVFFVLSGETFWRLESHAQILVGCCLAMGMHHERAYRALRPLGRPIARNAIVLGWVVFQFVPYFYALRQTALYPIVSALLIVALTVGESGWKHALSSRLATFVGERSYGMYLLHVLIMHGVAKVSIGIPLALWHWISFPIIVALTLLVAHGMYSVLESRSIAQGRAWSAARLARAPSLET